MLSNNIGLVDSFFFFEIDGTVPNYFYLILFTITDSLKFKFYDFFIQQFLFNNLLL